jgi:GR25 family glycosyltransferase involved in LPS biosynthesis
MESITFYMITIDRTTEERKKNINNLKEFIKKEFNKELKILGFDGNTLINKGKIKDFQKNGIIKKGKNFRKFRDPSAKHRKRKLRNGEYGCFISHKLCWENIVKNNIKFGIIFEDDGVCIPEFRNELKNIFDNLPEKWDYIDFQHHKDQTPPNGRFRSRTKPYNKFLLQITGDLFGTTGYLINTNGAKNLMDNTLPICYPVDCAMTQYVTKKIPKTGFVSKNSIVNLCGFKSIIGKRQ